MESVQKTNRLIQEVKKTIVGRDEIVTASYAAIIARQHILQIGAPGIAKSLVARNITESVSGARLFSTLLGEFSTPNEIFGPYSLDELKRGKMIRVVEGYMPDAEIVFIDEIFKASTAILNTTLTIINERLFMNDGKMQPVPLLSVFAASNEYPKGGSELQALYDRFLFRFAVEPLSDPKEFVSMLDAHGKQFTPTEILTIEEVIEMQGAAAQIPVAGSAKEAYVALWKGLRSEGVNPSDRRMAWALNALKAYALLAEREEVTEDLFPHLAPMLWSQEKDLPTVYELVGQYGELSQTRKQELCARARAIMDTTDFESVPEPMKPHRLPEAVKALESLSFIYDELVDFTDNDNEVMATIHDIAQVMDDIKGYIHSGDSGTKNGMPNKQRKNTVVAKNSKRNGKRVATTVDMIMDKLSLEEEKPAKEDIPF